MNDRIEKIINENKLLAIIIRSDYSKDGIEFFTPEQMWPAGT